MTTDVPAEFLESLLATAGDQDALIRDLIKFLKADGQDSVVVGENDVSREQARALLRELIPAEIQVRGVCMRPFAAAVAAPHAGFDNWSEYFCNRVARKFELGWVVAKYFRDQDSRVVPVSIGRFINVNRPTEADGPRLPERITPRAQQIHEDYLAALAESCGLDAPPIDLLIEFHSHRRSRDIEIATMGIDETLARRLEAAYNESLLGENVPTVRIEPMHALRMTAEKAKTIGSLRPEIARHALHIELSGETRKTEPMRMLCLGGLLNLIQELLNRLKS